ncbi:non-ribosomal peptide synthetase [Salinispora cortesiana]|uniref:non-ribosomal peptide synthetase n=1 Tax=Salinispora cortesiana TaxID=1305843 RepID=UPI00041A83E3|nr:non-ribosomal peptide synthetase [Salinispora cortesiana]
MSYSGQSLLRGPRVEYRAPHGLPGLVRDQQRRTPDAVACSDAERSLTYTELDLLSDALAAEVLRVTGGRRGAVALRMHRQVDLLVALLGIVKAGCHYLPVGMDEPAARLRAMTGVVPPVAWVVAPGQRHLVPNEAPAVEVPRAWSRHLRPVRAVAPDESVYALFTSGSTGTPKAVRTTSAALCNRILWMARTFPFSDRDRVLQKTPYTFDVAGWEFWVPLVTGARCVFAPVDAEQDAARTAEVIAREGITACHFVPTMLESYLRLPGAQRSSTTLHTVLCSGEALPAPLAARFVRAIDAELHNLYGPTEAAIEVTHWRVPRDLRPEDHVFIGLPIDNVDLMMLDPDGQPVAEHEVGELWLGGVQVAEGYVGRPDLTARAFDQRDGTRWYRTGDLVRVEHGNIRYVGRADSQVKIGGVRIEPGEVESVLQRHPAIGQVVVVPVESPYGDGLALVAVAVAADTTVLDHEIREFVAERLPRSFVPRTLFWVHRYPLTSAGKVDRRRVARDAAERWAAETAAVQADQVPDDELAQAWWQVLGTPTRQRRDDVGFLNLGGHSLAAARLVARVAQLRGVNVPLSALLRDNLPLTRLQETLSDAPPVRAVPPAGLASADQEPTGRSPLTPAQEPIWLLTQVLADASGYNVIGALRIRATVHDGLLDAAVGDVLARHDALRAGIEVTDGTPSWRYAPTAEVTVQAAHHPGAYTDEAVDRFVAGLARQVIDPTRPPLMRVGVLHAPDVGASLITVVLHHLVADQRTMEIVLNDLAFAYTARARGNVPEWPRPAPSFAAFAQAQAATVDSARWRDDLAYWKHVLADAPALLPLPFRLAHGDRPALAGRRTVVEVGGAASAGIDAFLATQGYTAATYFTACLATVLAAWSGEPAVTVGMPVSQRRRPEDFDLVGLVLGTVPLRVTVPLAGDRDTLLRHVRDRYVDALEHATPSFPAIVRRLGMRPTPQDNPLFQVWMNDLSRLASAPAFAGAPATWVRTTSPGALFDLNFYLDRPDGYRLELVHAVGRYADVVAGELLHQVAAVARSLATAERPAHRGAPHPVPSGMRHHRPAAAASGPVTTPWRTQSELVEMLRAIASSRPDPVALRGPNTRWTYAELLRRVDAVAERVTAAGLGPGDVLQLRARRVPALPVALLGAWRAGTAVAVTDAGLPEAVAAEQADLLRPAAVLTLDRDGVSARLDPGGAAPRRLDGISHVLFTSGTSGRPAAVAVPPVALAATLCWYLGAAELGPADRVAMLGGLGHDPLLRDILAPLLAGGTLVVPPEDVLAAPQRLSDLLGEERISVLHTTPALLELALSGCVGRAGVSWEDLRLVVSGGAPLTAGLVRALRTVTAATVVNAYGTTETPQIASCQVVAGPGESVPNEVLDAASLPVGAGVGGAELDVIAPDGTSLPVGHVGEVVVRSPHLAVGYLDNAGRRDGFERGGGTYRTGDRGRRDPLGAVLLDGRLDRQLCLDGHRVDPEQVERVALGHPAVRRALARLAPTPAGEVLVLQVGVASGPRPTATELRSYLRRHLPRHAVPTEIRIGDGSVLDDTRQKAAGVRADLGRPSAPPDELTQVVRDVVGYDIPAEENFFDAGLNSMTVLRLHAVLRDRLGINLSVATMFAYPNLAALARHIGRDATKPTPPSPDDLRPINGGRAEQRRHLRQRIRHDLGGSHGSTRRG